MPDEPHSTHSESRRVLSLWDTVSLILGMVIGTSIFRSPSLIFSNMSGVGSTLLLWMGGGVLSLVGALCYAELAATWPERGGDVTYLSRAFGNWLGYLLGWCRIMIIIPANVGIMSFAFQDYLMQAGNLDPSFSPWISLLAVAAMTAINLTGVQSGRRAQNTLTISKLIGFAMVILAGLLIASKGNWPAMSAPLTAGRSANPGLALVFVLYAFGGWNDAVYLAAELKEPQRNLPRALAGGVLAVLLVYLAVNLAYSTLGIEQLRIAERACPRSYDPGVRSIRRRAGDWAADGLGTGRDARDHLWRHSLGCRHGRAVLDASLAASLVPAGGTDARCAAGGLEHVSVGISRGDRDRSKAHQSIGSSCGSDPGHPLEPSPGVSSHE